jgi:hypothetical protein
VEGDNVTFPHLFFAPSNLTTFQSSMFPLRTRVATKCLHFRLARNQQKQVLSRAFCLGKTKA